MDREGKTALIVSCMNSERFHVAKTLLELGANVNAYRPGNKFFFLLLFFPCSASSVLRAILFHVPSSNNTINLYHRLSLGRNGGTPLHHATKRGLEKTVKLLLSHGGDFRASHMLDR